MRILVRFFAIDLPLGLTDVNIELADDATVQDAMDELWKIPAVAELDREEFDNSIVLLNGDIAMPEDPLQDGNTLLLMRVTEGG